MQTTYIAQAFDYEMRKGKPSKNLMAEQPFQYKTAQEAINRAERLAEKKAGAIAVAQEYDEDTGEIGDFEVLAQFGTLPEGLVED